MQNLDAKNKDSEWETIITIAHLIVGTSLPATLISLQLKEKEMFLRRKKIKFQDYNFVEQKSWE